jgi:pimeloyl-ACP methyl ester carboxylesterase
LGLSASSAAISRFDKPRVTSVATSRWRGASPIHAAARFVGDVRLLFIGGVEDPIAPIAMSRQLFEACNVPRAARAIWYAEGAGHLRAFETAPHEYEARVSHFFAHAALGSESLR